MKLSFVITLIAFLLVQVFAQIPDGSRGYGIE
jgi:hypothetical protein